MAEKIDELEVLITANTAQLKSGLKEVESKLSGIESSAGSFGSKLSAGAVAVGGIISSVFTKVLSQILANLDAGIARLDTLNNFTKVMGNLGIESGIAEQAINKLSDQLQGLPTSLSDAVSAVQRFTSANSSLQYSTDAFLAVNNAILAGGAGTQAQASALEQLAQAYSRNKMEMQDWKPILQAMPAQLKQVANYLNLASSSDLYDALQSGKVTMTDFMNAMIALNQNGINGFASFEDQARTATGGIQTSITNLKIAIQRGLANIMQVLGQSNIAGFFNRIASAIGTASNYIAAFIKLIKQAVAWIGALFGKGGSTTETVKETGSAMGGVASEAEAVGDNLDSANGSAKKLKHTLAGFDEMNVLTESESGGSGSSSSSSGSGGIDMSDYTWDDSAFTQSTDKIEQALEKIKAKFKELYGEIDTSYLGESIKTFWSGFQKAIDGATKAGEGFLKNYWIPFSKHRIEKSIPDVLTAIGNSLNNIDYDTITNALDHIWSALSGVVNAFNDTVTESMVLLEPVMTWATNNIIPPILESIAFFLNIIRSIIDGLWSSTKELWTNIVKPALDGLMKALEPILAKMREMFGSANDNEAIWDALSQVFTVVFNILNGPLAIGLKIIIDLITAIINVATWLYQTFQNIVQWIAEALNNVIQWFKNVYNSIKETFAPLIDAFKVLFTGIWEIIVGIMGKLGEWFGQRWNDIKRVFQPAIDWFKGIFGGAWNGITSFFSGIGDWFSNRWNDVKNVFSGVYNWFFNIGSNIWNGIKNGIGDLGNKLKDMFTNAINKVKQALGIASPSKVFKKLGGFVSEGFAIGIDSESDKVQSSLESLADFTVPEIGINSNLGLGISESLEAAENKPISLLLRIDGEDIPISAERITNSLNDQTMLANHNFLTV